MADLAPGIDRVQQLDARHDEVLAQLAELELRLIAVLKEYGVAPGVSQRAVAPAVPQLSLVIPDEARAA